MSKHKKHKPHTCINHPDQIARGRCVQCHTWLCSACGNFTKGQFTCAGKCAVRMPREKLPVQRVFPDEISAQAHAHAHATASAQKQTLPEKTKSDKKRAPLSFGALMLLAGWTLGCAGLVFGLWMARSNAQLKAEVQVLQQRRMELIGHIKDANEERTKLQEDLAQKTQSASALRPLAARATTREFASRPPIGDICGTGACGAPLSFTNGTTAKKLVCLTFDGGSVSNAAPAILDTLRSRNVLTTMFLTGEFIKRNPDLVRRMLDEGHEIGNHTQHHPHLTAYESLGVQRTLPEVSQAVLVRELAQANTTFVRLTGKSLSPLWRAPYGEINASLCQWAQDCGYLHVGWRQGRSWRYNLDSNDWIPDESEKGYHSPQEVLTKIMTAAQTTPDGINGGIVLMHLGTERKDEKKQVHRILGTLIDSLNSLGYSIVPVSKMLEESGVNLNSLPARP